MIIEGGDVVFVPEAGQLFIDGAVRKPGTYPISSKMTVAEGVALAGGLASYADTDSIKLIRYMGKGKQREILNSATATCRAAWATTSCSRTRTSSSPSPVRRASSLRDRASRSASWARVSTTRTRPTDLPCRRTRACPSPADDRHRHRLYPPRLAVLFVLATVPLLFGAVHPIVQSVYVCLVLVGLGGWLLLRRAESTPIAWRWLLPVVILLAWAALQSLPLPVRWWTCCRRPGRSGCARWPCWPVMRAA